MIIVIEMADVELVGVSIYTTQTTAREHFDECCVENGVIEYGPEDMKRELPGTLAIAGDDSYSVQMIQRDPA